jgi:hypothetical protein
LYDILPGFAIVVAKKHRALGTFLKILCRNIPESYQVTREIEIMVHGLSLKEGQDFLD